AGQVRDERAVSGLSALLQGAWTAPVIPEALCALTDKRPFAAAFFSRAAAKGRALFLRGWEPDGTCFWPFYAAQHNSGNIIALKEPTYARCLGSAACPLIALPVQVHPELGSSGHMPLRGVGR
ncbi:MAG: hypothetical protein ACI4WX_11730, partial [Aristaeellaceae bacterium]